ncbi:MAG: Xylose isomerase domain protein barrel [Bryobacterales bacterium]|nr:Xylose isomerase domain protein barrel [Bryobacterales bacterium]
MTRRTLLGAALAATLKALPLAEIKLGVTSDEIDDDPTVAADFLKRFGLHYVEVRNLWGKYNTSQPAEKNKEARAIFDAHDIKTSVVDTAFFRGAIPADDAALDKEWKLLDTAMERGDILGSKVLRIFAFMPKDKNTSDTSVLPRVHELLTEAAKRARTRGFRLAIENLAGSYIQTGADAGRLMKAVSAPNLGINWDPNNAAVAGENSFPDGYRQLDPARIFAVHLRDFKHMPDGKVEWAAVGAGEFDHIAQFHALMKDGYKGTYTLETHWRAPQGKTYSTETSLTALVKIIAKV